VQTAESSAEPTQPAGPRKRHPARRYPAESFTRDEVEAILAACSGSVARRNRALIIVLWRAGLRLGEALALRPRDGRRRGSVHPCPSREGRQGSDRSGSIDGSYVRSRSGRVSASSGAPRPGLRCSAPGVEAPYSRRTYESCCLDWRSGPASPNARMLTPSATRSPWSWRGKGSRCR
jgi:hypothetical protein